jgi:tRNA(Ile)-lysidine synthase TilS/MesJ
VKTLVSNISKTDPEAGFIWSETITDEDARTNSLRQTVQTWVKDDPDAAYAAVSDSKMAAAEKAPLLEIIERAQAE